MKDTTEAENSLTTAPKHDDLMTARPGRRLHRPNLRRHWRALAVAGLLTLAPAGVALADNVGTFFTNTDGGVALFVRSSSGESIDAASTTGTAVKAYTLQGGTAVVARSNGPAGVSASGVTTGVEASATDATFGTGVEAHGPSAGVFATGGTGVKASGHIGVDAAANDDNGDGMHATARFGSGVVASGFNGIHATGTVNSAGAGVYADGGTAGGTGVIAVVDSNSGNGIRATSGFTSGYGATLSGRSAPLHLEPATTAGAPTTGTHLRGDLYVDVNGNLFFCKVSGTPGIWKQIA
jgi:hypothetical protein